MKRTALALMILVIGLAPALADVRILSSPGGDVEAYLEFFAVLKRSGARVVLDGPCMSACTLVLSTIPRERICVTPRAVLGFHAARLRDSHNRISPAPDETQLLAETYPVPVQTWLQRHGGLGSKLLYLRGQELAALYPRCS